MLKILLVSENPPSIYGGIERHCYNIQLLFKNDCCITVDSLSTQQIRNIRIAGINKVLFNYKQLIKAINNSNCDVVHVHGFASFCVFQAILAASKCNKKIVYTAHFHPFDKLERPLLGRFFFYGLLKPILHNIDSIICINKEDTSFFKKFHSNVCMIPNWLTSSVELPSLTRTRKSNIVLFVGRNDANKSPEYLHKIPLSYEVHCVTNSSDNLSSRFVFHYKISDQELKSLYQKADLLVAPSRYEAFSYVVLEALSNGTPVLISDNVRIADYLTDVRGVTIFRYGSYDDFVSKFSIAINQNVDVEKVNEIFSPTKIKDELLKLYSK